MKKSPRSRARLPRLPSAAASPARSRSSSWARSVGDRPRSPTPARGLAARACRMRSVRPGSASSRSIQKMISNMRLPFVLARRDLSKISTRGERAPVRWRRPKHPHPHPPRPRRLPPPPQKNRSSYGRGSGTPTSRPCSPRASAAPQSAAHWAWTPTPCAASPTRAPSTSCWSPRPSGPVRSTRTRNTCIAGGTRAPPTRPASPKRSPPSATPAPPRLSAATYSHSAATATPPRDPCAGPAPRSQPRSPTARRFRQAQPGVACPAKARVPHRSPAPAPASAEWARSRRGRR